MALGSLRYADAHQSFGESTSGDRVSLTVWWPSVRALNSIVSTQHRIIVRNTPCQLQPQTPPQSWKSVTPSNARFATSAPPKLCATFHRRLLKVCAWGCGGTVLLFALLVGLLFVFLNRVPHSYPLPANPTAPPTPTDDAAFGRVCSLNPPAARLTVSTSRIAGRRSRWEGTTRCSSTSGAPWGRWCSKPITKWLCPPVNHQLINALVREAFQEIIPGVKGCWFISSATTSRRSAARAAVGAAINRPARMRCVVFMI